MGSLEHTPRGAVQESQPGQMLSGMANNTLLKLITGAGQNEPEAADALDRIVENILKRLRKGEVVALPGLGRLVPGPKPGFTLEKPAAKGAPRGRR